MYINVHSSIHNSKEAEMTQVSKNGQIKCVRVCSVVSNSLRPHGRSLPAPVSMGFPRQEYWSELLFLSPGNFNPGVEPTPPALASTFSTTEPPGSQQNVYIRTEWSTDRCYETDERWKHCYVKETSYQGAHITRYHLYGMSVTEKLTEKLSTLMVANALEESEKNREWLLMGSRPLLMVLRSSEQITGAAAQPCKH